MVPTRPTRSKRSLRPAPLKRIDPRVVRGFSLGSEAYEKSRPDYPDEARAFLTRTFGLGPGKTIVEIGAGTGKWTRQLCATGARVIAVEPLPAMRRMLRQAVPGVRVVARRGERTGLPAASTDLVTIAQAMHWLDAPRALEEFRRILRPGGGVAVVYNERREQGIRGKRMKALLDSYRPKRAWEYTSGRWKWALREDAAFEPLRLFRFRNRQLFDKAGMMDRYRSISFISALPPGRRAAFFRKLDRLLDEEAARTGSRHYTIHYHGKIYWTRLARNSGGVDRSPAPRRLRPPKTRSAPVAN